MLALGMLVAFYVIPIHVTTFFHVSCFWKNNFSQFQKKSVLQSMNIILQQLLLHSVPLVLLRTLFIQRTTLSELQSIIIIPHQCVMR